MYRTTSLITAFLLLFSLFNYSYAQSVESFRKIKVKGNLSVSYYIVQAGENKVVIKENEDLVSYKLKNNTIIVKHKKLVAKSAQKAAVEIYGMPLEAIVVKRAAMLTIEDEMLSDSVKVKIATGGELRANLKTNFLTMKVRTDGFGYLKGNINSLNIKSLLKGNLRANDANITNALVKINTGGFAAFNKTTKITGKIGCKGELKVYGESDLSGVEKSKRGVITVTHEEK
ncbi:MAG TPA: DUF2807 domain-containing protein [Salinivirgaceae bacterium]|nr:DUF2807 domain-containing protein [Salinivirgaceae bacterium]HQA75869.1 DUF2807 domain-containing protein [Salinivirgaceae bacterium]